MSQKKEGSEGLSTIWWAKLGLQNVAIQSLKHIGTLCGMPASCPRRAVIQPAD